MSFSDFETDKQEMAHSAKERFVWTNMILAIVGFDHESVLIRCLFQFSVLSVLRYGSWFWGKCWGIILKRDQWFEIAYKLSQSCLCLSGSQGDVLIWQECSFVSRVGIPKLVNCRWENCCLNPVLVVATFGNIILAILCVAYFLFERESGTERSHLWTVQN